MKKYISIVLLLSFVSLPLAQINTTVQNDNTSCEVAYADQNGTGQLKSLKRLSYCRTDFSLYMSGTWPQFEPEEDTTRAVIEEEQKPKSCLALRKVAAVLLVVGLVVGIIVLKNAIESLPDEW